MQKRPLARGWIILTLVVVLITTGTLGYMTLTGASVIDGLYMTIITISTVGYREIVDLSPVGKIFTICIILSGLGIVSYSLLEAVSFLIDGGVNRIFRRRAMEKLIAGMVDHIIVCGAGQTGSSVIEQFTHAKTSFIVIEHQEARAAELEETGIPVICGDATNEEVLIEAGILQAKGLISCLEADAQNVYTILTARGLNPKLYIVARSIEKGSAEKLKRAGADKTISPNEIGGVRMAYLMLKPHVVSFLDIVTRFDDEFLELGEVTIEPDAELTGIMVKDAGIPQRTGLIIIAIRNPGGKLRFNPGPNELLSAGSSMLVLGKPDRIELLRKIASNKRKN
ncbi:MAG: potassium channel protein [Spirochaetae bacterium HGW-Spirochaetae-8]|jgi:voltage-gated potassium channel|nr:MAG: potassium channel protein [Spirochaetae bacterium HGW-Spirochaetae-8]